MDINLREDVFGIGVSGKVVIGIYKGALVFVFMVVVVGGVGSGEGGGRMFILFSVTRSLFV